MSSVPVFHDFSEAASALAPAAVLAEGAAAAVPCLAEGSADCDEFAQEAESVPFTQVPWFADDSDYYDELARINEAVPPPPSSSSWQEPGNQKISFIMGKDGEDLALETQGVRQRKPRIKGRAFRQQVLAVCHEVAGVLRELPCCVEVLVEMYGVSRLSCSCTLTATIALEDEQQSFSYDEHMRIAQEAIYRRTSRGSGVCLLGYKRTPFQWFGHGFKAYVASVVPKKLECNRLFKEGWCDGRGVCSHKHPADIVGLNVVFVVAASL